MLCLASQHPKVCYHIVYCTNPRTGQATATTRLDGGNFGRWSGTRVCLIGSRLNTVCLRFAQWSSRRKNMGQMLPKPKKARRSHTTALSLLDANVARPRWERTKLIYVSCPALFQPVLLESLVRTRAGALKHPAILQCICTVLACNRKQSDRIHDCPHQSRNRVQQDVNSHTKSVIHAKHPAIIRCIWASRNVYTPEAGLSMRSETSTVACCQTITWSSGYNTRDDGTDGVRALATEIRIPRDGNSRLHHHHSRTLG